MDVQKTIDKHKGEVEQKRKKEKKYHPIHGADYDETKIRGYNDAPIYIIQEKFDTYAEVFMKNLKIDKEVFAAVCLDWVRYNAKWKSDNEKDE
jgi:hypothetical protein